MQKHLPSARQSGNLRAFVEFMVLVAGENAKVLPVFGFLMVPSIRAEESSSPQ